MSAQFEFDHARQLFLRGDLDGGQREAEQGYKRFQISDPRWASEFLLLKAESLLQRGMNDDTLHALSGLHLDASQPDAFIQSLAIESRALLRQQQAAAAQQKLAEASNLCKAKTFASCGEVLKAQGILAGSNGNFQQARELFLAAHLFAEAHQDEYLDANAVMDLGWAALQVDHFDEALDWLRTATRISDGIGAEDLKEMCSGNLGWAYYQLGDDERALQQFQEAEDTAARVGNLRFLLKWLTTAGYVYRDTGDLPHALDSYRKAYSLARQLNSKEDIEIALEDLAQISVMNGNLNDARGYIDQVAPMETADGEKLSQNLMLTTGMLAISQHRDAEAEADFRSIWNDHDSLTTLRLDAGSELAALYESQGRNRAAEREYKSTLTAYESARATLKKEESQLPFGANATQVYDNYIGLLVGQGRIADALAAAEQSRARTLEQGLDADAGESSIRRATIDPLRIARTADATLLFYWLGAKQSYLWAITPDRIAIFALPSRDQIVARIRSYSSAIIGLKDTQANGNPDGQWLYTQLVAPAQALMRREKRIVILADGALSELNFETLLVPGAGFRKDSNQNAAAHYLLEDYTLDSAPSLAMLGSAKNTGDRDAKMLLLGNPVSPSQDFPSLPLFGFEMTKIESHFGKERLSVFSGSQATPAAYFASHPSQYSYIHFVSHAIASRTDPLDSAIVLSSPEGDGSTFKLYAREIIKERIDARLVTISACYGSGTRFYAGEGLVGLSWAFLRAGAQRVVGALWEVSDSSTPRLMDSFYRHLADGNTPETSLRAAKLELIRSGSRFSLPFYWATFQMYERE